MTIRFTVAGKPQPKGSARAFVNPKTGRAIVTSDNPKARSWANAITATAHTTMEANDLTSLFDGPLTVRVVVHFARPKGHYGSGAKSSRLKPSAPHYHAQKPDSDKLARTIGDAMSGVVFRDDAQVSQFELVKLWGEADLTAITVESLAAPPVGASAD